MTKSNTMYATVANPPSGVATMTSAKEFALLVPTNRESPHFSKFARSPIGDQWQKRTVHTAQLANRRTSTLARCYTSDGDLFAAIADENGVTTRVQVLSPDQSSLHRLPEAHRALLRSAFLMFVRNQGTTHAA